MSHATEVMISIYECILIATAHQKIRDQRTSRSIFHQSQSVRRISRLSIGVHRVISGAIGTADSRPSLSPRVSRATRREVGHRTVSKSRH